MVPAGFNIFPLLRTPVPAGGYEAWRIVMKNGSRATEKVFAIFKVGIGSDLLDESKLTDQMTPLLFVEIG